MTQWVKFNDGEALTYGDLNDIQGFARRTEIDGILLNAASSSLPWLPNTSTGEILRPYGYAGAPIRTSSTNVRLAGGLWLYNANTATLSASAPVSIVALSTAYTDLTVAAASAGMYSRDIIQTRVVQADDAGTSRDFQDAVTGALSSQSMVKRTAATVEHAIKAGAEYASIATVVEPTADAGWIKTGSVLVDDTGINANNWYTFDWRVPFGNSTSLILPHEMIFGPSHWTLAVSGGGTPSLTGASTGRLCVPLISGPQAALLSGQQTVNGEFPGAKRVLVIKMVTDIVAAAGASDISFIANVGSTAGTVTHPTIGASFPNVGTRVTSTAAGSYTLYDLSAYTDDPPLWSNGSYSALGYGSGYAVPRLALNVANETGKIVYSVSCTYAG